MLRGKTALITGAGTGIGEGIAMLFAEEGANVGVLDRESEWAARTAAAIGPKAIPLTADVRDRKALSAAVDATLAAFGTIDVLINNAGVYPRQAFLDMSEEQWDDMQDINLKGIFHITQLVAPHMVKQRSGKIVNIASVTFFLGHKLLSHYVASKGGVIGFTRVLARELGPDNVHVNCITPGAIKVEAEKLVVSPEQEKAYLASQSLERRLHPIDVARVALFLSTPLSDAMTGQTLNVDGGWIMH
jgi:3-oxoacyl-[acyl-carrier protein] reductase